MPGSPSLSYAVLVAARPAEPFIRFAIDPAHLQSASGNIEACAWSMTSPYNGHPWVTAIGAPAAALDLAVRLVDESPPERLVVGVTVPHGALAALTARWPTIRLDDWTWWYTTTAPPPRPGEAAVVEVDGSDPRLPVLTAQSPSVYLRPGDPGALRWYAVPGADGRLLGCAAVEQHRPEVANLASVVVDAGARGGGLAADICAVATRAALAGGGRAVTLGMMSDNEAARRVYTRLGFTSSHRLVSGYIPGRRPARVRGGVHPEAATG